MCQGRLKAAPTTVGNRGVHLQVDLPSHPVALATAIGDRLAGHW